LKKDRIETKKMFDVALDYFGNEGFSSERVKGIGKWSIRRLTHRITGESEVVCIRTSQTTWLGFHWSTKNSNWEELAGVDAVFAVSVDNEDAPQWINVHHIPAKEIASRLNRLKVAKEERGLSLDGKVLWISLYDTDAADPVKFVGAGAGLSFAPIHRIPFSRQLDVTLPKADALIALQPNVEVPLTIPDAKKKLAASLGVPEDRIRIFIEA
jgi:hypothetical protein